MFEYTSRYYNLSDLKITLPNGEVVTYKSRRILPQGDDLPLLVEVQAKQGERLDTIAARILGDPEQFWRICDANNTMDPLELTNEPGLLIRISLPQS
jgi:hypothetical protein